MVFINGLMVVSLKEIGRKIKLLDTAYIIGKMVEYMKDIGTKIICTDKGCTNGQMADNTMEITLTIKRTATEFIRTLTEDAIRACGEMANSTVRVHS